MATLKEQLEKFTRGKYEFIGNSIALLLIISVFGISTLTLINLTPGFSEEINESNILGVEDSLYYEDSLAFKNTYDPESIINKVEILAQDNDSYKINIELDKYNKGKYYLKTTRIINKTEEAVTIEIVPGANTSHTQSLVQLMISDISYQIYPEVTKEIPNYEIAANKSLDLDLFINQENDVNFSSVVELYVKVVE